MKPVWSGDSRLGNHRVFRVALLKLQGLVCVWGVCSKTLLATDPFFQDTAKYWSHESLEPRKKNSAGHFGWNAGCQRPCLIGILIIYPYFMVYYKSPHHWVGFHPQKKPPMKVDQVRLFWESYWKKLPNSSWVSVLICWKTQTLMANTCERSSALELSHWWYLKGCILQVDEKHVLLTAWRGKDTYHFSA